MAKFVLGLIVGMAVVPAGVYLYFASGSAPVATSAKPMRFEKMLVRKALRARIEKELPKSVPIAADDPNLEAGAKVYVENCAVCHGLPGKSDTAIAQGMYPKPPRLFEGTGVTDDPAQETYWKIAGGIRLTGMPGFQPALSETQMWQVSLLLANAGKVREPVKNILAGPVSAPPVQERNSLRK